MPTPDPTQAGLFTGGLTSVFLGFAECCRMTIQPCARVLHGPFPAPVEHIEDPQRRRTNRSATGACTSPQPQSASTKRAKIFLVVRRERRINRDRSGRYQGVNERAARSRDGVEQRRADTRVCFIEGHEFVHKGTHGLELLRRHRSAQQLELHQHRCHEALTGRSPLRQLPTLSTARDQAERQVVDDETDHVPRHRCGGAQTTSRPDEN
jgi:hypothetical protein